ncbi:MAG: hypothetical protein ACI9C1_003479 [Candidatus Aldehydirespiratoraceae bacterium]|jgi:hypothetical protein
MRALKFELAAMGLVVMLAGVSVFATFGSARSTDIVFCQLVDGDVVVGVTTDCADATSPPPGIDLRVGASRTVALRPTR